MNIFCVPRRALPAGLLAVALLAGCSPSKTDDAASSPAPAATTPGSSPAAPSGGAQVAFVTNNASDFWTIARKGCEKADDELADVKVDFEIPPEGTAAAQKTLVDNLLAKGVKGIAISPVDPTNETQMLNNAAKNAVVLTQDSDAPKSDRACYIGTDNRAAGKQAGNLMKKALPNGGKIMLFVGKKDAQNAHDREMGIRDALQGTKIQILDVRTDDTDRARAKANVSDTLVKYPDLAGAMGLWSYNGPAILNAVTEAGKVGKVKIVCFDEEKETLAGVKSGAIAATVVQQPYEFGYQAVKMMADIIKGDKNGIPASKQKFVPTIAIDKSGVDAFSTKLASLTGK